MDFFIDYILIPLIKIAIIMAVVPGYVAVITLAERKVIAWMQVRLGPMRVGPWGVLQMVADPIKLLLKEDIIPARADRWVFIMAPVICLIPALVVLAVIPIGPSFEIFGRTVTMYVTDLISACSMCCRSLPSAFLASFSADGLPTVNTRCSAPCVPQPRW